MSVSRERRIETVKRRLLRRSMPRFQVSLILLFTGLAGFLTSYSLLHSGVPWMWLRYPVAILIAYCVFLLLLRLWLWLQRHDADLDFDPSALDFGSAGTSGHGGEFHFGGGGDFGGGGAGGSWEGGGSSSASGSAGGSFLDSVSVDLDLEEGWFLVLAIVALIGGLIASFYVIYIAPALLAEILLDGLLVTGLYKRVKHIERRHWLRAAVRRTLLPAILAATFFTVAGYALGKAAPGARSIGEAWRHITSE